MEGKGEMNIYAVKDSDGFVKIGISEKEPTVRLAAFQTGNAKKLELIGYGTHDCAAALEEQLHNCLTYQGLREQGEWFKPSIITTMVANVISVGALEESAEIACTCAGDPKEECSHWCKTLERKK